MENIVCPQSPSQRTANGTSVRRPVTSSTLSATSQSDLQLDPASPNRRKSVKSVKGVVRPRTFSTSSQAGNQHEWEYTSSSHDARGTTATTDDYKDEVVPVDFWPLSDPEDETGDETPGTSSSLKRSTTTKSSSTTRMFRAIMQRFGRSYNNRYDFLPNDAQEKDRNTLQHNIAVEVLDGRLYLAPVTNPRRVLDLGCGPGDWTIDVAKRNPTAAVFGIDVEPVKPRVRLPNCRFHLGDFTEKWPYDGKFDLIHLRHLGSLPSKDVIATMYDRLEPGGWVEFCEWIVAIQSPRNSLADSWFYKWAQHWEAGLNAIGTSAFYPEGYKQLLLEAGFQNVTIRKYGVPINPWPPGKQLQKVGSMMVQNTDLSIEPMSHAILGGVLGWSTDAIDGILSEVRKELNDTRVRNFMTLFCVYAQKPRDFSSSSTSLVSAKSR